MDGREKMDQIVRHRTEAKEDGRKRYLAESKERLRKNIASKIRTVMIGDLARVEAKFGRLWGQGKPKHALTDQEIELDAVKEELRTEILNHGNNLLRAAMAEIDQYDVDWKRYQYDVNAYEPEESYNTIKKIVGLNDDGTRKKLRYGTHPDGSVRTSPEGSTDE